MPFSLLVAWNIAEVFHSKMSRHNQIGIQNLCLCADIIGIQNAIVGPEHETAERVSRRFDNRARKSNLEDVEEVA